MSPFNVLLPALLFLTPVLAHFKLDYPTSRGYDVNNETQFCGGFPNVTTRNPWYLEDGKVKIEGLEDGAKVNILITFIENPTSLTSFTEDNLPDLKGKLELQGRGTYCFNNNLTSILGAEGGGNETSGGIGLVDGTNATILVQYIAETGTFYQCSDVTLSSDATQGSKIECKDSLTPDNTSSSPSVLTKHPFKSALLFSSIFFGSWTLF